MASGWKDSWCFRHEKRGWRGCHLRGEASSCFLPPVDKDESEVSKCHLGFSSDTRASILCTSSLSPELRCYKSPSQTVAIILLQKDKPNKQSKDVWEQNAISHFSTSSFVALSFSSAFHQQVSPSPPCWPTPATTSLRQLRVWCWRGGSLECNLQSPGCRLELWTTTTSSTTTRQWWWLRNGHWTKEQQWRRKLRDGNWIPTSITTTQQLWKRRRRLLWQAREGTQGFYGRVDGFSSRGSWRPHHGE